MSSYPANSESTPNVKEEGDVLKLHVATVMRCPIVRQYFYCIRNEILQDCTYEVEVERRGWFRGQGRDIIANEATLYRFRTRSLL